MRPRALVFSSLLLAGVLACLGPARAAVTVSYATIDVPGADATEIHGIVRTGVLLRTVEVVGIYHNAKGTHGFLLVNGRYTTLNYPGAHDTWAQGMNGKGDIVGLYAGSDGIQHGFLYAAGAWTKLTCPIGRGSGPFQIAPNAINAGGVIVGDEGPAGFVDVGGHCQFPVRENALYLNGINSSGLAVGTIVDASNTTHGQTLYPLLANPAQAQYDVPGAIATWAAGINDAGQIAGFYRTSTRLFNPTLGFVYAFGAYATLDVPGAWHTEPLALDSAAFALGSFDVVGRYRGLFGTTHGFIASVAPQAVNQP